MQSHYRYLAVFGILALSFMSCTAYTPISKVKAQNNKTYDVAYLFEHDGCKVYRFVDGDNVVYFTNCTGDVTSIKQDSTHVRIENKIHVGK